MKKRKVVRQLIVGFLSVGFLFGLRLFAVAEPDSTIGFALFRCSYEWSFNKAAALGGFDANLEAYKRVFQKSRRNRREQPKAAGRSAF